MDRLSQDHLYCIFRYVRRRERLLKMRLVAGTWYHAVNRVFVERGYYVDLERCALPQIGRLNWVRHLDIKGNSGMLRTLREWPLKGLRMECPREEVIADWELSVTKLVVVVTGWERAAASGVLGLFPCVEDLTICDEDPDDYSAQLQANLQWATNRYCTKLRSLQTEWNFNDVEDDSVGRDAYYTHERPNWRWLTKLQCRDMSGSLARHLQNLQSLELTDANGDGTLYRLTYLTSLRELTVRGRIKCGDVDELPKNLTRLIIEVTEFHTEHFAPPDYISPVGTKCPMRINLPRLVSLELIGCGGVVLDTPMLRVFSYHSWLDLPKLPTTIERLYIENREFPQKTPQCHDLTYLSRLREIELRENSYCDFILPSLHRATIQYGSVISLRRADILTISPTKGGWKSLATLLSATSCHTLKIRSMNKKNIRMGIVIPDLVCLDVKCYGVSRQVILPLGARELLTDVVPDNLEEMIAHGLRNIRLTRCLQCSANQETEGQCDRCPLRIERTDVKVEYG